MHTRKCLLLVGHRVVLYFLLQACLQDCWAEGNSVQRHTGHNEGGSVFWLLPYGKYLGNSLQDIKLL